MSVRLAFVAPLLSLIAIVAVAAIFLSSSPDAGAGGPNIATIAIDTNTTGNTVAKCTGTAATAYPCNTSTTLGTIDTCRSVNVGDVFTIDIVGISLPLGGVAQSFTGAGLADMQLDWTNNGPTGAIEVTNFDTSVNLVHAANPGNTPVGERRGARRHRHLEL